LLVFSVLPQIKATRYRDLFKSRGVSVLKSFAKLSPWDRRLENVILILKALKISNKKSSPKQPNKISPSQPSTHIPFLQKLVNNNSEISS